MMNGFYAPNIYLYVTNNSNYVAWEGNSMTTGFSVRCLKDNTADQPISLNEAWNLLSFSVEH
jgi:hypothetical protein